MNRSYTLEERKRAVAEYRRTKLVVETVRNLGYPGLWTVRHGPSCILWLCAGVFRAVCAQVHTDEPFRHPLTTTHRRVKEAYKSTPKSSPLNNSVLRCCIAQVSPNPSLASNASHPRRWRLHRFVLAMGTT